MGDLTGLQRRVLSVLVGMEPRWTLTGGGALVGYVTHHRTTLDLDLFWHGLDDLAHLPREVVRRLHAAGMAVTSLQSAPAFERLRVDEAGESVVVDLVAEPVPTIEAPVERDDGVWTDTPHELLVNKLTTLVSRSELRDLEDVRALVAAGADLQRALRDAPKKDGGFSPLVLAWSLRQLPLDVAPALGFDSEHLAAFRESLIERLTGSWPAS